MTIEAIRARDAKALAGWCRGEGPHPHGKIGHAFIVPRWETKNTWDTHPLEWECSEWARHAGMAA